MKEHMTPITREDFIEFLLSESLYTPKQIVKSHANTEGNYCNYEDYFGIKFSSLCERENSIHTFKTSVVGVSDSDLVHHFDFNQGRNNYSSFFLENDKDGNFSKIILIEANCSGCNFSKYFLIQVYSSQNFETRQTDIYAKKVGQYPALEIDINNETKKYLHKNDLDIYKKGIICIKNGYGIGAYCYLRRVVENLLLKVLQDIAELEFDNSAEFKRIIDAHKNNPVTQTLIDAVQKISPNEFIINGQNIIKLLYSTLSSGIHNQSDKECLEKANSVDTLFNYLIHEIYKHKNNFQDLKNSINSLIK